MFDLIDEFSRYMEHFKDNPLILIGWLPSTLGHLMILLTLVYGLQLRHLTGVKTILVSVTALFISNGLLNVAHHVIAMPIFHQHIDIGLEKLFVMVSMLSSVAFTILSFIACLGALKLITYFKQHIQSLGEKQNER